MSKKWKEGEKAETLYKTLFFRFYIGFQTSVNSRRRRDLNSNFFIVAQRKTHFSTTQVQHTIRFFYLSVSLLLFTENGK
jgi:hypothetical protein